MSLISLEGENIQNEVDKNEAITITDRDLEFFLGGMKQELVSEIQDSVQPSIQYNQYSVLPSCSTSKMSSNNGFINNDQLNISDALKETNQQILSLQEKRLKDCTKISTLMNQVSHHTKLISNLKNDVTALKTEIIVKVLQSASTTDNLAEKKVIKQLQQELALERAKRELLEKRLDKIENFFFGLTSGYKGGLQTQQSEISNDDCSNFSESCEANSLNGSSVSDSSKHKRSRHRRRAKQGALKNKGEFLNHDIQLIENISSSYQVKGFVPMDHSVQRHGEKDVSSYKGSCVNLPNGMEIYSDDINPENKHQRQNDSKKKDASVKKRNKPANNKNQQQLNQQFQQHQKLKKTLSQPSISVGTGISNYMDDLMLLHNIQINSCQAQNVLGASNLNEKEGAKGYFEKAQQYLSEQVKHNNNGYAGNIGLKLNDRVLGKLTLEWRLRKRDMTKTEIIQHSGTFYTDKPGYRVQLKSQLDRLHGDIYFSVRILQGLFDETIEWPFQKKFRISISDKMKGHSKESWIIPLNGVWIKELSKPTVKKDAIVSEWKGPFNISQYLDAKTIFFDVSMCN